MKNIALFITALIALCAPARADVLVITSAPYFDGHSNVSPYNSLLNGSPIQTFCLEYEHHVGFNTPFDVTVVNLHNFAGPLHDNFWQAGWLALQTQGVTDIATLSDISAAIWLICTPGTSDPYLTSPAAFVWANQAALNYQSVPDSSFTLLLRSGDAGQAQLFMVPEPATYFIFLILGASLLWFIHLGRKQRRAK